MGKVYLLGSVIDSLNPNLTFASVVISSYDCIWPAIFNERTITSDTFSL